LNAPYERDGFRKFNETQLGYLHVKYFQNFWLLEPGTFSNPVVNNIRHTCEDFDVDGWWMTIRLDFDQPLWVS